MILVPAGSAKDLSVETFAAHLDLRPASIDPIHTYGSAL
jgi:hypothetical protein